MSEASEGQIFESQTALLTLHKNKLLLYPKEDLQKEKLVEPSQNSWSFNNKHFKIDIQDWSDESIIEKDEHVALIDYNAISEQLKLKLWNDGDRFQPLGLNGQHQKVQDFLSNKGINRIAKRRQVILVHGTEIVWIVGLRLDHRFRIQKHTTKVLSIESI